MNKDLAKLIEIDNYLAGELTNEEKIQFEEKIREHHELKEDVQLTDRVIKAIRGYGFKQMLKKIHQEHFGNDDTA